MKTLFKNNIFRALFILTVVTLAMPSMPFGLQTSVLSAQTACGAGVSGCARTTLSSAVAAGSKNNLIPVASVTGITASGTSVNVATNTGGQTFCLVDRELVQVRSINSTTKVLTVSRATKGLAVGHVSGAQIICGGVGTWDANTGASRGVFFGTGSFTPSGSCTRTQQQFLPIFSIDSTIANGFAYDCLGGKWVQGTLPDAPDPSALILASNVPLGSVAYGSLGTTTAGVATVEWLTSIYVPKTGYVTGINVLAGGTATTDNILAILRDSTGNVIANAATAGVLLSGASTFQTQAFTAALFLVGPARYFIGVQTSGATAGDLRTIAASTFPDVLTGQLTGGTFGTIVNPATMPTTFTATQGPIVEIYY